MAEPRTTTHSARRAGRQLVLGLLLPVLVVFILADGGGLTPTFLLLPVLIARFRLS